MTYDKATFLLKKILNVKYPLLNIVGIRYRDHRIELYLFQVQSKVKGFPQLTYIYFFN